MNKKLCNISVIIPTLNRPSTLINTIKSMNSLLMVPKELIIVDQSDIDLFEQTKKMLVNCSQGEQLIRHIHLLTKSSTVSRNYGISIASQNIIVFCDDDIEFFEEVFYEIESIMNKNKTIALIGGFNKNDLRISKLTFRQKISSLFYLKPSKGNAGVVLKSCFGFIPVVSCDVLYQTNWAMGFFFAVRKSVLLESGVRFDEKLTKYAYGEDLDFTYRFCSYAKAHGFLNYYCKRVVVNHLVAKEYRENSLLTHLKVFINRRYLSNKLFGNSFVQHWRLEISNKAYLFSLRNDKSYHLYKQAYKVYKKRKKLIDKEVKEINSFYDI